MTHHNFNLKAVSDLFLELLFPVAHPVTITTTCITENQHLAFISEGGSISTLIPMTDGINSKRRGIARGTYIDIATMAIQLIESIGYCLCQGIFGEIMVVDFLCFLASILTRILEIAAQFLFLGINTDDRMSCLSESLFDSSNVAKLTVTVDRSRGGGVRSKTPKNSWSHLASTDD